MGANYRAGPCEVCGGWVEVGAGRRMVVAGRWVTVCPGCEPAQTAPPPGDHDGWHHRTLIGLDTETTGTDPTSARIVSVAVIGPGREPVEGLIDPGPDVEIPAEATAVHGITTAHARLHGKPAAEVLRAVAVLLGLVAEAGVPLVVCNAPYDLTLLRAELTRHGLQQPAWEELLVIDPLVLDRHVDRYRSGSRRLASLCGYYGVEAGAAHTAAADALAAVDVARAIGARYPLLAAMSVEELHAGQVGWHAEQAAGLQAWLRRKGSDEVVDTGWPLRALPSPPPAATPATVGGW